MPVAKRASGQSTCRVDEFVGRRQRLAEIKAVFAPFQTENPGISVFARDGDRVFHTYSTCSRGLDMLNVAYHYLDLVPAGRNQERGIFWIKRHDEYKDSGAATGGRETSPSG